MLSIFEHLPFFLKQKSQVQFVQLYKEMSFLLVGSFTDHLIQSATILLETLIAALASKNQGPFITFSV